MKSPVEMARSRGGSGKSFGAGNCNQLFQLSG